MRCKSTGVAAGVLAFLAVAVAAEAQGNPTNTPTGPLKVYTTDSSSTYTSVINSTGPTYVRLRVFYLGVIKHNTTTFVSSYGVVNFSKLVTGMNTWGMQAGQQLNYNTRVWLASNPAFYDLDDWWVPIEAPTSYEKKDSLRAEPRDLMRFRREELCA